MQSIFPALRVLSILSIVVCVESVITYKNNSIESSTFMRSKETQFPTTHLISNKENNTGISCIRSCLLNEECVMINTEQEKCELYSSLSHASFSPKSSTKNALVIGNFMKNPGNFVKAGVYHEGFKVYILVQYGLQQLVHFYKDNNFHRRKSLIMTATWLEVFPLEDSYKPTWISELTICMTQGYNGYGYFLEVCKGDKCLIYDPPDTGYIGWKYHYKNNNPQTHCKLSFIRDTYDFQVFFRMSNGINPMELDDDYDDANEPDFAKEFVTFFNGRIGNFDVDSSLHIFIIHNRVVLKGETYSLYDIIHVHHSALDNMLVADFYTHETKPRISINPVPLKIIPIFLPSQ